MAELSHLASKQNNQDDVVSQRQQRMVLQNNRESVTQRRVLQDNRETSVNQRRVLQDNRATSSAEVLSAPAQRVESSEQKPNNTGLSDQLKAGIESLSGMSMDHVKVHYNSDKPAQLNAHAYAQGSDIHLASGQEKHLPHEAWHVVQQAQGRVKPTMQMKGAVNVNDDVRLEKEADGMGQKSLRQHAIKADSSASVQLSSFSEARLFTSPALSSDIVQMKNRIDIHKVTEDKKVEVESDILNLKITKKNNKKIATVAWVMDEQTVLLANELEDLNTQLNNIQSGEHGSKKLRKIIGREIAIKKGTIKLNDRARDERYNVEIEKIRKQYEIGIKALEEKHVLDKSAVISGNAFYGDEVNEEGVKFYRRSDTGKEYVKDNRGTFIPRYVRRELNHNDVDEVTKEPKDEIKTTGISTDDGFSKGGDENIIGDGVALTFKEREFLQQSRGGGENQFAQSHTSTKRPILSNAHDSFGEKPKDFDHSGAIITDLAQTDLSTLAAQWELDPKYGHKIPLQAGKHTIIDAKPERDEVVRMSGYRNMEVITQSIPNAAIVQPDDDDSWKTAEGPKDEYNDGTSKRGSAMESYKAKKAAEALSAQQEKID